MRETARFERERATIAAMIRIYCRDRHGSRGRSLCDDCAEVLAYAGARLDKCLFPESKPTCATCPVHCYKPAMRARVKEIMRYAGPRMIYQRPILALRHWLDGRRNRQVRLERRRPAAPSDPAPPDPSRAAGGPPG